METKRFFIITIFLVLIGLGCLPLMSLLRPGLPVTHDGPDHVARIANFYQALYEGNIVPRWAGNLNWGYGHPILMFLYPLPSYIASFFKSIGFGFVDSVKMVFACSFIASILSMYIFVQSVWGKRAGCIAALLYGFAPYRFIDMYVRGAIGEHVAFIFPPLVLYFLYQQAKKRMPVSIIGTTLALAGLILSHNAMAIMFLPLIICWWIYILLFEVKKKWQFAIISIISLGFGFSLSAFFWMPAFFEGKYTLRDIVTKGSVFDKFVPWTWFFSSPWNYGQSNEFSKSIGIMQWVGLFCSFFVFFREKKQSKRWFIFGLIVLFFFSLFLMTSGSSLVWHYVSLLQKFQFPWRLLSVSVFCIAFLGGIGYASVTRTWNKYMSMGVIVFFIFATTYGMWQVKGYTQKPESYYSSVYEGTTDTGESAPIWSIRFMEHRPDAPIAVITNGGTPTEIISLKRTTTLHEYQIIAGNESRILENTLYFPGWNVYVDGIKTDIQFQDPDFRGLMTFMVPQGKHSIRIQFENTKVRSFSNMISITTAISIIGIIGWSLCKRRT